MFVRILLLLLAALALSGCKFRTYTDLYISDLEEVAAGKASRMDASILISIQVPTPDECRKKAGEVVALLARYFGKTQFHQCARDGFEDYLVVRGNVPVLRAAGADAVIGKDRGFLYFIVERKASGIVVHPRLVTDRYRGFQALVSRRYSMQIDAEDVSMGVVLRNDGRGERQVEVCGVYADQQAVPFCGATTVPRRRYLDLQLSTILSRYLLKHGRNAIPLITVKVAQ